MTKLTARLANKLAIEMQIVLIKCLDIVLKNTFEGKSILWGKVVSNADLVRSKEELAKLERMSRFYEKAESGELPYFNSNSSFVEKTKIHFGSKGMIGFIEAKDGASAEGVERHVESKGVTVKRIRKQLTSKNNNQSPSNVEADNMATKKKVAKKVAKKSVKGNSAAKHVYKGSRTAQQFRDDYDKDPKGFNVAEYATKHDVAYGRVYGAIVKHVGGVENVGKAAPKKKAAAPAKKSSGKTKKEAA